MTSTAEDDEGRAAAGHGQGSHSGYDLGRLLAFSDGVFAVAITLLVFGIPVPDERAAPVLVGALQNLTLNLLGFAVSFVLVGAQWILHHRLLRRLTFCDGRILWINLLLLMGICLVPFATSLLVRFGGQPAGAIPYAALQAGIGLVFTWLRLYLKGRGVEAEASFGLSWVQIAGFLVSIPLALRRVELAYVVWMAGFAIARASGNGPLATLVGRLGRWTRSRF